MNQKEWLAERFEEHRPRLRAAAYRMLGSLSEADDVLQDAWVRLSGADAAKVESVGAWLTTVVARLALNALRSRRSHPEQSLEVRLPEPILDRFDGIDPEHEALAADSVGLAMLVVLGTLAPAERVAFVLHDMFAMPFDEIARIVDRSPAAARQLASRARRRLQESPTRPDANLDAQWMAAEAFMAAARDGDFRALLELLDPMALVRADFGSAPAGHSEIVKGAEAVARRAVDWARVDIDMRRVLVNGTPGAILTIGGRMFSVAAITVVGGRVAEIDFLGDPDRLAALDLAFLDR